MKLMILDGNSIVNRAFFGVRMLNAPDGTPTNGVYGFLTILQKLIRSNPDNTAYTARLEKVQTRLAQLPSEASAPVSEK